MTQVSDTKSDVDLVRTSTLFDAEWYVHSYPDVVELDIEPAAHYLRLGEKLGRYPSVHFDPAEYARTYALEDGQNALLHYIKTGQAAGHDVQPLGRLGLSQGSDLTPPTSNDPDTPCYMPNVLAQRAFAWSKIPWPADATAVYGEVRAHFDPVYYVTKYYDMAQTGASFDLVRHYVRAGDKEGRSPSPHFSSRAYRRRYADTLKDSTNVFHHWVTQGRKKGMIAHAMPQFEQVAALLGMEPAECQEKMIARKNDVRARLESGVLGEMVQKATAIEPLVSRTWRQAFQPNVQPFHRVESAQRMIAIHALQKAAGFKRAKAVVCVDGPRWGSNRRLEGHVTHALAAEYGAENVIFMGLDSEGKMPAHKYPRGVRCINVANITMHLKDDERQRVVLEFLRSLRADAVFNVNSGFLWNMQSEFGTIMKNDVPIIGCFFCNDKSIYGTWGGYPASQFYRHFDTMKAVCTDSHYLRDTLIEQYFVPADQQHRICVLEAPVNPDLPRAPDAPPNNVRPQLFWASRLDLQKRLDVVYEIARQMPHLDIRMWGQSIANGPNPEDNKPSNVILEGSYDSFDELPLEQADAWLYTSEWDGVPSILLEVAMTGLPMIGSLVGGTGEVLQDGLSWPVAPCDDVAAYVAAIEGILSDPDAARHKARTLRDKLADHRTEAHYQSLVRDVVEGVEP